MRKELQLEEPESPDITYDCMVFVFQVPTNGLGTGSVYNLTCGPQPPPATTVVLPVGLREMKPHV